MKLEFTQEDIDNKVNIIEIEDIVIEGNFIIASDDTYTLSGKATIDGEVYTEFLVEFTLEEEISELSARNLVDAIWEEYDFIFN